MHHSLSVINPTGQIITSKTPYVVWPIKYIGKGVDDWNVVVNNYCLQDGLQVELTPSHQIGSVMLSEMKSN